MAAAPEAVRSASSAARLSPMQESQLEQAETNFSSPGESRSHCMTSTLPLAGYVSASDNGRFQILCETPAIHVSFPAQGRADAVAVFLYKLARSVFVTKTILDREIDFSEVASRLMSDTSRALRLVIRREPKPYRPFESEPKYLLCYVIEQLECGHELTVYPQADPLIAKRRVCPNCQGLHAALPPKKPTQSVKAPTKKAGVA